MAMLKFAAEKKFLHDEVFQNQKVLYTCGSMMRCRDANRGILAPQSPS